MEIRKVGLQEVEKKIFCPGFEQFFDKNTSGAWTAKLIRVHIAAPDGVVGVFEYMPGKTDMSTSQSLTLLFTDHLGSVDLAINIGGSTFLNFAVGSTRTKYSYDPWGQRRNADTWSGPHVWAGSGSESLSEQHTDRGFTGHEMLDELGLINMNARIYDPLLGRFLSADTLVPHPGDLQSYNRYSYCDNNPLSRVDPSGHGWLSKLFHGIGKFFKKYWKVILSVVIAVVAAIFIGPAVAGLFNWLGSGLANAMICGYVGGFAGGFSYAAFNGSNFREALSAGHLAGRSAAYSAGLAHGVGVFVNEMGLGPLSRALAHGFSQGALEDHEGGKFGAGFLSAFSGSLMTKGSLAKNWSDLKKGIAAAIVGGTASEIGGGKFSNGAIAASMIALFNPSPTDEQSGDYDQPPSFGERVYREVSKIRGVYDYVVERLKFAGRSVVEYAFEGVDNACNVVANSVESGAKWVKKDVLLSLGQTCDILKSIDLSLQSFMETVVCDNLGEISETLINSGIRQLQVFGNAVQVVQASLMIYDIALRNVLWEIDFGLGRDYYYKTYNKMANE